MFGYVIILFTLQKFTTSFGYNAHNAHHQGSIVTAMVQVGFCIGRPLAGLLADYYGPATVTFIAYYISSILALAMWLHSGNYANTIVLQFSKAYLLVPYIQLLPPRLLD
ncbi:unnamed protein product [Debaryomyces tyrocola]|nr:unnamed protein product [Debaryomyces tyrocola]